MKIKLPRKRKKAFKKAKSKMGYVTMKIANKIKYKQNNTIANTKFIDYIINEYGEIEITKYW